jgi:hypothetical protein
MTKRYALIACALLASAGTAVADDAGKDSMTMHQKMLDDCVAKQDPGTDRHAAMKACVDMLDKQMADKQMADPHMADKTASGQQMPHDEAGKEAPIK